MKKFYVISILFNFLILIIVSQFIYKGVDNFLTKNQSLFVEDSSLNLLIEYFYSFIFWWIVPFSILFVKNYKRHIFVFISPNILWIILLLTQYYLISFDRFLYDIALAIALGVPIAILTYYSQMILGKKLLPTLYRNSGVSLKQNK